MFWTRPALIRLIPVLCEAASDAVFNQWDLSCDWRTVDSSFGAVFSRVSGPLWLKWILWRHWWVAGITRSQTLFKADANEGISCWHPTVWGVIVDHFVHSMSNKCAKPIRLHCAFLCVRAHVWLHPPLSCLCTDRPNLQCMDSAEWNV